MRRIFGFVTAAIATTLTVVWIVVLFDTVTGDYTGGEVQIVWTITGFVGVLMLGAWIGALALLAKEENRRRTFLAAVGVIVVVLVLVFLVGLVF